MASLEYRSMDGSIKKLMLISSNLSKLQLGKPKRSSFNKNLISIFSLKKLKTSWSKTYNDVWFYIM